MGQAKTPISPEVRSVRTQSDQILSLSSVHNVEQGQYAVLTQKAKTLIRLGTRISSNRLNVHGKVIMICSPKIDLLINVNS